MTGDGAKRELRGDQEVTSSWGRVRGPLQTLFPGAPKAVPTSNTRAPSVRPHQVSFSENVGHKPTANSNKSHQNLNLICKLKH